MVCLLAGHQHTNTFPLLQNLETKLRTSHLATRHHHCCLHTTSPTSQLPVNNTTDKMTRNKPRAPSSCSSDTSCYTVDSSGWEVSSGVGVENAFASLTLDPTTPVLNKLKARCRAESVPVGETKAKCKEVRSRCRSSTDMH